MKQFLLQFVKVFPWWYTHGLFAFARFMSSQVSFLARGLAFRDLAKNLFKPLYGFQGRGDRIISFIVRLGHFILITIFMTVGTLTFSGLLLLYILFPALIFLPHLDYRLPILAYTLMLLLYLTFKELSRPPLQKRKIINFSSDYLFYSSRQVRKIFRGRQSRVQEALQKILQTETAKKFFLTLEVQNPKVDLLTFQHDINTLFAEALDRATIKGHTHITSIDIVYAAFALKSEKDPFWESLDAQEAEILGAFEFFENRQKLRDYQREWASYSFFRRKHGLDRGLTSPLTKELNSFSKDVTQARSSKEVVPLVGREEIFETILNTLKDAGGAVLVVGRPGEGKSRIVEYLAERVAADDVPGALQDSRLVELDVGRILSGDAQRQAGEGSKNLITVLDEAAKSSKLLLSVDGLTGLMGGQIENTTNLGILSKYVEDKKVRLIATTTQEDYDRILAKHPTLIRQFNKIRLGFKPLGDEEILEILEFNAINFEREYQTVISQRALKTIVEISQKHRGDIANPAQSLTLFKEALIAHKGKTFLAAEDLKQTLQEKTGINLTEVTEEEQEKLQNLEAEIHKSLIGQEHAVKQVADALRRARLDLHHYEGPIAKFLFVGPTGVGKTELAKIVARIQFGSEDNMLRLDMSEFQEVSSIRRLIGDENITGLLTEPIRNKPHRLILLDELEKAHPDILNLLLQVLDDGRLTDGQGRVVDFRNTVVIATSNAGADKIFTGLQKGTSFEEITKDLKANILLKFFRPEFLNRFNNVIVFEPHDKKGITTIAELLLEKEQRLFKKKEIEFDFTPQAAEVLAEDAYSQENGARPLKNMITERIESELANGLLNRKFIKKDHLVFDGKLLKKA